MYELWLRARRKWFFLRGNGRGVTRYSNLIASRRTINGLKDRFDEMVPPGINVEINTNCNYACAFCPQSSWRRPVRYMTWDTFEVLIKRLEDIDYAGRVCMSVNNEPFLHPLVLKFCETITRRLPKARGSLISNGALITKEHLLALAKLEIPPHLQINDYTLGHTVSKRLEAMFAEDQVLSRIPFAIALRGSAERLSNRAGSQPGCESNLEDYQDIVCTWPFIGMFLTPELKAFLCCSDYQHRIIMGDLGGSTVMSIWRSEAYRNLRCHMMSKARSGLTLCAECDTEWFSLPAPRTALGVATRRGVE